MLQTTFYYLIKVAKRINVRHYFDAETLGFPSHMNDQDGLQFQLHCLNDLLEMQNTNTTAMSAM